MSNWHELLTLAPGETPRIATTPLRVPEDVAFASLDVPADWSHMGGIVQNHRLVGMRAMEQLSVLVKTYHRGAPENPSATYVPGFWRDGATAPRKARRF
jgi:LacI family transcriptional regulator